MISSSSWAYYYGLLETGMELSKQLYQKRTPIPEEIQASASLDERAQYLPLVYDSLINKTGSFLGSSVIVEYLTILEEEHSEKFSYSPLGVILNERKSPYEIAIAIEELKPLLFIPYDYFGHHVVIAIDMKNRRIEYYDPKGAPSNELRPPLFNLRTELEKISLFFLKEVNIIENLTPQQTCHHRCGLWGLFYIENRLLGKTPEEISSSCVGSVQVDDYKVHVVAEKIKQKAIRLLQNSKSSYEEAHGNVDPLS